MYTLLYPIKYAHPFKIATSVYIDIISLYIYICIHILYVYKSIHIGLYPIGCRVFQFCNSSQHPLHGETPVSKSLPSAAV